MKLNYVKCECCNDMCMRQSDIWKNFVGIAEDKSVVYPVEKPYNLGERLFRSHLSDPIMINLQEMWDCSMHLCRGCLNTVLKGKELEL